MVLFPFSKPPLRSPSPAWSVYDDHWGSTEEQDVNSTAADEHMRGPKDQQISRHAAFISRPPFTSTLKGSKLKKKAPIRRGAQGAVYVAYDTSLVSPGVNIPEVHVDSANTGELSTPLGIKASSQQQCQQPGSLVAVKRIFVQSNDFGARDISATVLREVTLHRFVCARQDECLLEAKGTTVASPSCALEEPNGVGASQDAVPISRPQVSRACLIDESARVLRLHRIVEAPHREMCLVLELAATNLERLLTPSACYGAGGISGGGHRKKQGTVTLFGGLASAAGLGDAREDRGNGESNYNQLTGSAPSNGLLTGIFQPATVPACTRCPLLSQMPLVRYVMRRLLRLVCFLHENCGVVHRDLKPSNVLVAEDGGLRLGDFGSSRFTPPTLPKDKGSHICSSSTSAAGAGVTTFNDDKAASTTSAVTESLECTPPSMRTTLHYRPPEVLFGDQACRPAADVWALGVMFAQLLLQKNLFHAESELDLLGAIQKLLGMPTKTPSWIKPAAPELSAEADTDTATGEITQNEGAKTSARPPFTIATDVQASLPHKLHAGIVSAEGLDLVTRMLNQLPEHRLTIREAMAHPFLNPRGKGGIGDAGDARLTAEDDRAGEALWKQKVSQELQNERLTEGASVGNLRRLGVRRPMFAGLCGVDDDSDDDCAYEERRVGDTPPFRLNLCDGGYSSSP